MKKNVNKFKKTETIFSFISDLQKIYVCRETIYRKNREKIIPKNEKKHEDH